MKRKILGNVLVAAMLMAFAFFISMMCAVNLWESNGLGTDSCVFRYIALAMSKGEVMYRDCFDHKGPLTYFINYLGMSLSYYKGIWMVEILFLLGTVWGIYKIAHMFCGRICSLATTFIVVTPLLDCLEGGNFTEEYAVPLILWSLYIFLDYFLNEKISGMRIFWCGFLFSCVSMLRANMIAVWLVFCVAVLIQKLYQKKAKELLGFLGWFLLGCMVVLAPIALYLCVNGAFGAFVQEYLLFNISYSANSMEARLLSCITYVDTYWMLASLGIMLYVFAVESDRKRKYVYGMYFLFMLCSIMLTCMSGYTYGHYAIPLISVFVFPFSLLLGYVEKQGKNNKLWYFMIYCCIILCLPPWVQELKNTISSYYQPNEQFWDNPNLKVTVDTILENSTEEDRITVWGNSDSIYVHTKRLSASRYSFQFPLVWTKHEIYDEYFRDLEEHPPKLVVMSADYACGEIERMQEFFEKYHYEMILDAVSFQVYSAGQ